MPWRRWLLVKWRETPLELMGSVMAFGSAEMNESQMPFEVDVDEPVVVVTVEREVAVVNESLRPTGGNDEELVL